MYTKNPTHLIPQLLMAASDPLEVVHYDVDIGDTLGEGPEGEKVI